MSNNNSIIYDFDSELDDCLKLDLAKVDDYIIEIHCVGYIDTYNSNFFLKKLTLVTDKYSNIILNFSGINYISSTGIGAITAILKTCRDKNGDLILINVCSKIYEIFQLLGFVQFFIIKSSLEDAKNYFKKDVLEYKFQPTVKKCPICNANLKVTNPGKFRCANCKSIIKVSQSGEITLL
jgi:anti-anti-sigma factor